MTTEVTDAHESAMDGGPILPLLSNRKFTIKDLTYSIREGDADYQQNFKAGVESVLDHVSEFTELTFTYAGETGGNLRLNMPDEGGINGGSGPNGNVGQAQLSRFGDQYDLRLENGAGQVLLHEIGHAFGMAHPHRGDFSLPRAENSLNASVMSYGSSREDAVGGRIFYSGEGITPTGYGLYDIAHLQYLYGANMSFNSGNDVYEFDADTPLGKTIWDGGGIDVFSTQTSKEDSVIDLRSGLENISSVGKYHLWVAYGAEIENAFAGSGDDVIYGNDLANELRGNDGNDMIDGGVGDDIILGGAGDDLLAGGKGADVFTFGIFEGNDIIASFGEAANSGERIAEDVTPTGIDFQVGIDKLELEGFKGISAANVMNFVTEDADGNAQFEAEGTTITLFGVSRKELSKDDFVFSVEPEATPKLNAFANGDDKATMTPTVSGTLITEIPNEAEIPEITVFATLPDSSETTVTSFDPSPDQQTETGPLIAINIGSDEAFKASDGTVFAADTTGVGNRYSSEGSISGTDDDVMYQSESWGPDGLDYAFDLEDGIYDVRLHFAEIWQPAFEDGVRTFDITLEDKIQVDQFDVFAESGGRTANVVDLEVVVTDGELNLSLEKDTQNPKLSGLEISRRVVEHDQGCGCAQCCDQTQDEENESLADFYDMIGGSPNGPAEGQPLVAINIGSDTGFTAADGTAFSADTTGIGNRYSSGGTISGTDDDTIYKTEAWDPDGLEYAFDLADGKYEVRLHFAEIWNPAHNDGIRVFDIAAEDNLIMEDLDIFAESGGRTAHIIDFDVMVTDGELNLSLIDGIQNPKLSAIEIWRDGDADIQLDLAPNMPEMMMNAVEEEFVI